MTKPANPGEIALQATRTGFFQDVVVASSRLLHGETANERERLALQEGSKILGIAATSEALLRHSATKELSDTTATLAVIRAAGIKASDSGYFEDLRKAIQKALRGDRDDKVLTGITMVRELFLAVNEASLDASIRLEQEKQSSPLPTPFSVSSSS